MERLIDASGIVLGRMCSYLAKRLLLGDSIIVVNCEKAVISGNKKYILRLYQEKRERGQPTKGVFFPRRPDLFFKRTIRGMLPYKQYKGITALRRLHCYIGMPDELKGKNPEVLAEASVSRLSHARHIALGNLCKLLGGRA